MGRARLLRRPAASVPRRRGRHPPEPRADDAQSTLAQRTRAGNEEPERGVVLWERNDRGPPRLLGCGGCG